MDVVLCDSSTVVGYFVGSLGDIRILVCQSAVTRRFFCNGNKVGSMISIGQGHPYHPFTGCNGG
eukprot:8890037-Ditylum_brightwellii.AAC.1